MRWGSAAALCVVLGCGPVAAIGGDAGTESDGPDDGAPPGPDGSSGTGGGSSSGGSSSSGSSSGGSGSGGSGSGATDAGVTSTTDTGSPAVECPYDPDEPNDSPAAATEKPSFPFWYDATLCAGLDDRDVYRYEVEDFDFADWQWVEVTVEMDPGDYEADVVLYAGDGVTEVARMAMVGGGYETLPVDGLPGGPSFIEIVLTVPPEPDTAIEYRVGVDDGPCSVHWIPCELATLEPPADPECRVPLDPPAFWPEGNVLIAAPCVTVPEVGSCAEGDGWTYPELPGGGWDYGTVQLCGTWCDELNAGREIAVWYWCNPD